MVELYVAQARYVVHVRRLWYMSVGINCISVGINLSKIFSVPYGDWLQRFQDM